MLIYLVVWLIAAIYLAPLLVVVLNSLRTAQEIAQTSMIGWPKQWAWNNYATAWADFCVAQTCAGIRPYMLNSAIGDHSRDDHLHHAWCGRRLRHIALALSRRSVGSTESLPLASSFPSRCACFPGPSCCATSVSPTRSPGLVLIHTIQGLSFTTLFCRNYYIAIPPDLIKAARIDGAGFLRIFWRIVLPLSPPILIVTVIWQFTDIWNEFLYGVTFTTGQQQPVTAALIALSASIADIPQHGVQSAAVMIAALPTLLIYFFGGRYFMRGLTAGAVK